jgi:pimeloyl-ACP methyl ester carboxylesterase
MSSIRNGILPVPGASLFYEIRGSGPLLLMVAGGGGGGAGNWNGFVDSLADAYTVVTYDRRGAFHSPLDPPVEEISLETHSDDASRLLSELTMEPAYVFGTSAGALISLDLVAHYSKQVRTLVAHEPPAHYLLPEEKPSQGNPLDVYRREDALAAVNSYMTMIGVNFDDREPGTEIPQKSKEEIANADAFFKYNFTAVRRYRLDFAALSAASTRIVVAGGSAGRMFVAYRAAVEVATRLGVTLVEFPGHHVGYRTYPRAFAERLRQVLEER